MMRSFTFITYDGEDAGEVLCTIMNNNNNKPNVHKIETETRVRIGFQPNEEPDDEKEEPDEEPDSR